ELITTGREGTVRFWDVASGELERVLYPPLRGITASALSPDGHTLALSSKQTVDKEQVSVILLVDVESTRLLAPESIKIRPLKGAKEWVDCLAFSPDGKWLASAGHREQVRLWDLKTGEHREVGGPENVAWDLAFSPDGKHLLTAPHDGPAVTWTVPDGKQATTFKGVDKGLVGVAWSPDGKTLATGGAQGVHRWDRDGKKPPQVLSEQPSHAITFSPDGHKLLNVWWQHGGGQEGVSLLEVPGGKELWQSGPETRLAWAAAFSPSGALAVAAGGPANNVLLLGARDGRPVHRLGGAGRMCFSAAWGPEGKVIAWGHTDGTSSEVFQAAPPLKVGFSLEKFRLVPNNHLVFTKAQRADLSRGKVTLKRA